MKDEPKHELAHGLPDVLASLSDEDALVLAHALAESDTTESLGAAQQSKEQLARKGLDLVRFAIANDWHLGETKIDSSAECELSNTDNGPHSLRGLPTKIGRFQVIQELGRGGFGVVLLAQDPVLHRMVALKIPRLETLLTASLRNRFEREARAVGMLSHPGIVPLLETELQGPVQFIAFAYMPGESLDKFASTHREIFTPALAAKVLTRLADAVQHAHQRGVIHRDLKPGNILIASREQSETFDESDFLDSLRITDFGLAKIAADGKLTRDGSILGTPAYMSPEQAAGNDELINEASDIYSLGAILYELLTGVPPFQSETELATLRAVELESPIPPRKLAKVPFDLDSICLKCLDKDPRRRYASARDLANDLERWLTGFPVLAKKPSMLDRVKRWGCRNPGLAFALSTTFLSLSIGLTVTIRQQQALSTRNAELVKERERAKRHAAIATNALAESETQRKIAFTQSAIASSVRNFLFDDVLSQTLRTHQIETMERARALGNGSFNFINNPTLNDVVLRNYLELNDENLERKFPGQPEVQAELLLTEGKILRNQGMNREARLAFERAASRFQQTAGDSSPKTLEAEYYVARSLLSAGNLEAAKTLLVSLVDRNKSIDPNSPSTYAARYALAETENAKVEIEVAIDILKSASSHYGNGSPQHIKAVNQLALRYHRAGNFRQVETLIRSHLPKLEENLTSGWTDLLDAAEYLAVAELRGGHAERALDLLKQVAARNEQLFGSSDLATMTTQLSLIRAYSLAGQHDESIKLGRKCLGKVKTNFGEKTLIYNAFLSNLAVSLWTIGEFDEAEKLQRQSVQFLNERFGKSNSESLKQQANHAISLRDLGRYDEAIQILESIDQTSGSRQTMLWMKHELLNAYIKASRFEDAITYANKWLAEMEQTSLDKNDGKMTPMIGLGIAQMSNNDFPAAQATFKEAIAIAEAGLYSLDASGWKIPYAYACYAQCLAKAGEDELARTQWQRGCAGLESQLFKVPQAFHADVAKSFGEYADFLRKLGELEEAKKWSSLKEKITSQ